MDAKYALNVYLVIDIINGLMITGSNSHDISKPTMQNIYEGHLYSLQQIYLYESQCHFINLSPVLIVHCMIRNKRYIYFVNNNRDFPIFINYCVRKQMYNLLEEKLETLTEFGIVFNILMFLNI